MRLGLRWISCTLLPTLALACAPSSPAPDHADQRAAPTAPEPSAAPAGPTEFDRAQEEAAAEPDSAAAAEPTDAPTAAPAPARAPTPAPAPETERSQSRLDIAVPSINGGLNRDIIRRIASSHSADILDCHGRALASMPDLLGELRLELWINERGQVTNAELAGDKFMTEHIGQCVVTLAMGWSFAEAGGVGSLELELDFSNE